MDIYCSIKQHKTQSAMNNSIDNTTAKAQQDAQQIVADAMNTIVEALENARAKKFEGEMTDAEFEHYKFQRELERLNDKFGFLDIARRLTETELV